MEDKYYVVKKQNGGCDYTIGCGIRIEKLRAKSMQEAISEVMDLPEDWLQMEDINEEYLGNSIDDMLDYYNLTECKILKVSDEVDMLPIMKKEQIKIKEVKSLAVKEKAEKEEREKYEALKLKFEGK